MTFCNLYGITRMYIDVLEKCATFLTILYIPLYLMPSLV